LKKNGEREVFGFGSGDFGSIMYRGCQIFLGKNLKTRKNVLNEIKIYQMGVR
jgi:hypothetical protein